MIAFIALSALLAVATAQFPYQQGYGQQQQSYQQPAPQQSYQPQQYQPQPQAYQAQAPSHQPQAQAYQPQAPAYQPQQTRSYQPAAVHYVDIGKDLAGDYKFGYDTGKGNDGQSFREETRLPDGTVQGAYGYVDGSGKQTIIKYTAGKDGYRVEGDGIPKAPAAPAPAQQSQPAYNYGANQQSSNSGGYY